VIALKGVEHRDQRLHRLWRCEQPQRVAGRCRVDDDEVEARPGRGKPDDLDEADQLVDPGHGELEQLVDVVPIQPRAMLNDVGEGTAMTSQPPYQGAFGVELHGAEPATGGGDCRRPRGQTNSEGIPEGMGRIG